MDTAKIGSFLAALRRERHWTQAMLGDKLGVTNKTVSRWETGEYLPPVEMLEALGDLYGLTVDEILDGARQPRRAGADRAAEPPKQPSQALFTLRERQAFFQKKYRREHGIAMALCALLWAALLIALALRGVRAYGIVWTGVLLGVLCHALWHNRMMAYVEGKLYGDVRDADGRDAGGGRK